MNFIARFLRAFGRILLAVAGVLAIGFAILLIPQSEAPITPTEPIESTSQTSPVVQDHSNYPVLGIFGFIVAGLIIFGLYKSLRHYNNALRSGIRKLADRIKCSIYATELTLTTVIWGVAVVLSFLVSPYIATVMLFAMITNLLCFIFAWLCYGQPTYSL